LPDGSPVLVCYYLLGGYTAAPSGLYARFCHAFLVVLSCISLSYNLFRFGVTLLLKTLETLGGEHKPWQ